MKEHLLHSGLLRKDSEFPTFVQLHDILRRYITDNRLEPGTMLPKEMDLMKIFKVSRGTVRRAIERLAVDQLVYRRKGVGTFVSQPTLSRGIMAYSSENSLSANAFADAENRHIDMGEAKPLTTWLLNLGLTADDIAFRVRRKKVLDDKVVAVEVFVLPTDVAEKFTVDELKNAHYVQMLNKFPETTVHSMAYSVMAREALAIGASFLEIPEGAPFLHTSYTYYNQEGRPVGTGSVSYPAQQVELRMHFALSGTHNAVEGIRGKDRTPPDAAYA